MSATGSTTTGFKKIGHATQLPGGTESPLQVNTTSTQAGQGQAVYFDGSANVALSDGTVPGLTPAGVVDAWQAPLTSIAGANAVRIWQGLGSGVPGSTISNDTPLATSIATPIYDAGSGVAGLLSNSGGNDRSVMGLSFGLAEDGTPITWISPVAAAIARAILAMNADAGGLYAYAADASATTDQGSASGGPPPTTLTTIGFVIPRPKRRSILTAIDIVPSAALAHAATNYRVIQVWKVDTTGTVAIASSPLVGTFTTVSQDLTAGQPTAFTLGTALTLRETDILVGTSLHFGTGATVPQSAIRAHAKVI